MLFVVRMAFDIRISEQTNKVMCKSYTYIIVLSVQLNLGVHIPHHTHTHTQKRNAKQHKTTDVNIWTTLQPCLLNFQTSSVKSPALMRHPMYNVVPSIPAPHRSQHILVHGSSLALSSRTGRVEVVVRKMCHVPSLSNTLLPFKELESGWGLGPWYFVRVTWHSSKRREMHGRWDGLEVPSRTRGGGQSKEEL